MLHSPTIVLLHGLGRSRYSMSLMGRYLRKKGFQVYNFGYPSRRSSIDAQAVLLAESLRTRFSKEQPLSFVTHSLGSIVLRRFANCYSDNFTLKRAVMLGPPNQGSFVARHVAKVGLLRFLIGPALLEVANLSERSCADKLEIGVIAGGGRGDRGYSPLISGNNDAIVSVEETKLDGMREHLVVPGLHSFLMYQPRVQAQVLHFLQNGKFLPNPPR